MFGYVEGGKVQDVTVADSYICGSSIVGGVCGKLEDGTIKNCYNTGKVTATGEWAYVGGVCGFNNNTITNCYNTGDVTATDDIARIGGVCGDNDSEATIANCYNTGDVTATGNLFYVGGVCGCNESTAAITNCYFLDVEGLVGIGENQGSAEPTAKSDEQFKSGEVCYLLNAGDEQAEPPAFYQNIGKDISPVLDSTHHTVKYDEEKTPQYYNEHSYENGICTICGGYEPADAVKDVNDIDGDEDTEEIVYEISNASQLYWFAEQVNSGNTAINAELTKNITVNSGVLNENGELNEGDFRVWTPIGCYNEIKEEYYLYSGTFDGNNKTISGLYFNKEQNYVGLFGCVYKGSTVRNVTIADSYFRGNSFVGGICGDNYMGTIENCSNTGKVTATGDFAYVGGVCGYAVSANIKECSNAGTAEGNEYVGGICGYAVSANIKECSNAGTVKGEEEVGGICGYSAYSTIENSFNINNVINIGDSDVEVVTTTPQVTTTTTTTETTTETETTTTTETTDSEDLLANSVGCVCGNMNGGNVIKCYSSGKIVNEISRNECIRNFGNIDEDVTITDFYYLTDTDDGNGGKTAQQFASGEVCWLLNVGDEQSATPVFYQNIGKDDSPVLDSNHHAVKYDETNKKYYNEHTEFDENGFCTVCGNGYEPAKAVADVNDIDNDEDKDETVYEISNVGQLYWFADKVNSGDTSANAELTKNITVNSGVLNENGELNEGDFREWTPIGNDENTYRGTFDGKGNTISGLYFNKEQNYVGLFGNNQGTIKNVTVADSYFCGEDKVGGVCGYNEGTIENCSNTGDVTATGNQAYVGGVCGENGSNGTIANCYNTGKVTATGTKTRVGGVCGYNKGTIQYCYNTGDVTATGDFAYVGGVCGYNNSGTIANCYNTGNVSATYDYANVGGVCGYNNSGTIENCSNTGDVTTGEGAYVGGVCGVNAGGTIENCSNTGDVTATGDYAEVGGVCGDNYLATIENCSNTGIVEGNYIVGGVCGYNYRSTIENCYNKGVVTATGEGAYVGGICGYNDSDATITNCYFLDVEGLYGVYLDNSGSAEATEKSDDQFKSGEVCYLLNGGETQPETPAFYQTLGEDAFPVLDSTHGRVYLTTNCVTYSNTSGNKNHSPVSDKKDATCTEDGYSEYWFCKDCGKYFSDEACKNEITDISAWKLNDGKISAAGHSLTKTDTLAPTCTTAGHEAFWYCKTCDKYFSDADCQNVIENIEEWLTENLISATGHSLTKTDTLAPTCTTDGHEAFWYCKDCNKYFSDEACKNEITDISAWKTQKSATGHSLTKTDTLAPTCTTAGHKAFWYCEICKECFLDAEGTEEIENIAAWLSDETKGCIPKLSHSFDAKGFCTTCENGYQPATDSNGDGTYEISNAGQLYWFADKVNSGDTSANAELTNDITVNEKLLSELISVDTEYYAATVKDGKKVREWTPIGDYTYTNNYITYKGTFNGNNHTVSGLYFNKEQDFVGLFGCVEGGKVQDVIVADSYFCGSSNVGGVCGYNYYGTIENCSNIGDVTATGYNAYNAYVGGICGVNAGGTIENCSSSGINVAIAEIPYVGGVCGNNAGGKIKECYNTGDVSGNMYVGGVCGYNVDNSTIENCYNKGEVAGGVNVGGICGINDSIITNCYNEGEVNAVYTVGGVCGCNNSTISNCYNTGDVTATDEDAWVGGVSGDNYLATIENCYFLGVEGLNGVGNNESEQHVVDTTAMSEEQFASGEAAYKLGKAFFQTLGEDAFPVLDKTHGTVYITTPCNVYSNTAKHLLRICDRKGKSCTEDGHEAYWYCEICNKYYSDSEGTNTIENIDEWLTGEGRIPAGHDAIIVKQMNPTCVMDGCKAYWFCENCRKYYVDEECTKLITDREDFEFGEGRIPATGIHVYKNGYCEECGKPENSKEYFYSAGLTITDGTIINYLVNVDDDFDTTNAKIIFSIENGKKTEISFSEAKNLEDTNNYIFALPVAPNLMREKITAQVVRTDGSLGSSLEYSVEDYLVQCLEMFGDDGPEVKETVDAIRAYGDFAKAYSEKSAATPEYAQNCEIGSEFNYEKTENAEGLKIQSASLILSAGVSIHLQYKVTDGKDYTFSYNGKNELRVEKNGDIYDVYLDGIFPQDFDEMFEFTSSDGDTFTYSVFTYIKDKIGSDDISLTNLLNSMYEYNQTIEKILV